MDDWTMCCNCEERNNCIEATRSDGCSMGTPTIEDSDLFMTRGLPSRDCTGQELFDLIDKQASRMLGV